MDLSDKEVVEVLCDIEEGLNEWETKFVDSVATQVLDKGRPLTPRQRETADRIISEAQERETA